MIEEAMNPPEVKPLDGNETLKKLLEMKKAKDSGNLPS